MRPIFLGRIFLYKSIANTYHIKNLLRETLLSNLIINSSTASVYLPSAIRVLRKWIKHRKRMRYSSISRTKTRFASFMHKSAPCSQFPQRGCGCCSCAAPIPSGHWLSVLRSRLLLQPSGQKSETTFPAPVR